MALKRGVRAGIGGVSVVEVFAPDSAGPVWVVDGIVGETCLFGGAGGVRVAGSGVAGEEDRAVGREVSPAQGARGEALVELVDAVVVDVDSVDS